MNGAIKFAVALGAGIVVLALARRREDGLTEIAPGVTTFVPGGQADPNVIWAQHQKKQGGA